MAEKKRHGGVAKNAGNRKNHPVNSGSFKKGKDPRRNTAGQRNKASVMFFKQLRELIVKEGEKPYMGKDESGQIVKLKKVEWMIKVLWQAAIKGEAWAIQFITEKVEGKITQPIGGEVSVNLKFDFGDNSE